MKPLAALVLAVLGIAGFATRHEWLPSVLPSSLAEPTEAASELVAPTGKIIVNEQAQQNLGLTAKALKAQTFWKTIQVPGMVVDRAGLSDRDVTAPTTAIVAKIHRVPGEIVHPGEALFTLKLLSESLQTTQTELFKATQNIKLAEAQRKRLVESSAAPPASIIEVENQITRLQITVKAYRQELLTRGLGLELIEGVGEGKFASEIIIVAPPSSPVASMNAPSPGGTNPITTDQSVLELQDLKVDLGQQVLAGQLLCRLANHRQLAIEGRAFRDETPLLEKSVKEKWPIEVDFQEDAAADWGLEKQTFRIQHMANTIDPVNRTFCFMMFLDNQSRSVTDEGHTQTLWRYRPGQKVRLLVRVEKLDNVFVLPSDAIAHEGPEAFVFTQNVNTFERKPVHMLLQDRQYVVLANDGSIVPGIYVVQGGAAQLNRMLKAGGSGGAPKGYHIHADGSLHKNEDEGK